MRILAPSLLHMSSKVKQWAGFAHLLLREGLRKLDIEVDVEVALLVRSPMYGHALVRNTLPCAWLHHLASWLRHLYKNSGRGVEVHMR